MSNLEPSVVALDSGLNLQTAKIIAPPGSVLDTLNYEQVDFQGQKRIDGYARYDGGLLPALDEYYVLTLATAPAWGNGEVLVTANKKVIGRVLSMSGTTAHIAIIDYNRIPTADSVVYVMGDNGAPSGSATVLSCVTGSSVDDVETHYTNLLDYMGVLRTGTEELPGGIIGLQWFRDRLYAVADVAMIFLDGTTPQIFPEDVLTVSGVSARVLDSYTGDTVRVVFLDTQDTGAFYVPAASVTRGSGEPVGNTAAGDQYDIPVNAIASFFESRSEQQVIDEDGSNFDWGWKFNHLGWQVNFQDGLSLFGSLPSTNQNIEGLGIQGPTSTAGNNGRPLVLLQKVNISNAQAQVNGWKSTQTPTSYLLDPDDLTEVDTDLVYADGYISWDGTTGQVSAPGATSGTLQEYAASSTIEVQV
jgi:hypothetical protein